MPSSLAGSTVNFRSYRRRERIGSFEPCCFGRKNLHVSDHRIAWAKYRHVEKIGVAEKASCRPMLSRLTPHRIGSCARATTPRARPAILVANILREGLMESP